jgi:hypothetical protein
MRLLKTSTLELHEFFGEAIPSYAILSHRWETEEVTFEDLQAGKSVDLMKGFSKIKGCCKQAALDFWEYAWVDSCCIEKKSSAELSEAINSMFQWYQDSQVCDVYLSDVPTGLDFEQHSGPDSAIRRSQWWERGWTLQELLAPRALVFYDCAWVEIGTKRYLENLISEITGILHLHLKDHEGASVAQKMSWQSRRATTRTEDLAYSLMGLFKVHMPPLYGEGTRAFERLQLEILASSDDESLFAWAQDHSRGLGLLASSPSDFIDSGDIYQIEPDLMHRRPPFAMTNKGLRIESILLPTDSERTYLAPLNCGRGFANQVAVELFTEWESGGATPTSVENFYQRGNLVSLTELDKQRYHQQTVRTVIFVKQRRQELIRRFGTIHRRHLVFLVKTESLLKHGFTVFHKRAGSTVPGADRPWKAEALAEGRQGSIVVFKRYEDMLWLSFAKGTSNRPVTAVDSIEDVQTDGFIVLVQGIRSIHAATAMSGVSARIIFPEELPRLRIVNNGHILDRLSRKMPLGGSVSVALTVGMKSGEYINILDVIIDPEGKLPWPYLGS